MDVGKERWEGEMYGEVTRKLTLPDVKWRAHGNLLYDSGNSDAGALGHAEGWDGAGVGREVWLILVEV